MRIVILCCALVSAPVGAGCDEPGGRGFPAGDGFEVGGETADEVLGGDASGPGDDATSDTAAMPDTSVAPDTSVTPDTSGGPAPVVSATCIDGQYDEELPDDRAAIGDLIDAYSAQDYLAFTDQVLARRYPFGGFLVSAANEGGAGGLGNCITAFTSNRASASGLIGELSTVVHECGHIYDLTRGGFSSDHYAVHFETGFTCERGDTTARGGETFARSRLNHDAFAALLPDDFYRDVYLDGDPDDGRFDGGDQGFNSVLEETTQYVNSLATDWALRDNLGSWSISSRDGILTFLWYIQRYLHMARRDFPGAYQRLSGDPCWRQAILTVWGRAWLYLDLTEDIAQLGLDDDAIEALVLMPELLDEIELLRRAHGCP